jgi:hypothetical protein
VNSEELELSLRTEFENYLKAVAAEMRQETTEFQSKIEAEFERHKTQFDEAVAVFIARLGKEREFDAAFSGSVSEHLRLARDEGAKIAANAMAEAEKLDQVGGIASAPSEAPVYDILRDAINDISSKDSQSAILKSLVHHAADFAPRGAFFIMKNENFVGWKVFGTDDEAAEAAVREIHFPTSSDSILGVAARSLATTEGAAGLNSEDSSFLEPLKFGHPDKMFAIPLVARGRCVAVLYADHGEDAGMLNREALEMLVRVAGLTVELHATSLTAKSGSQHSDLESAHPESSDSRATESFEQATPFSSAMSGEAGGFSFSESVSYEGGLPQEVEPAAAFEAAPVDDSSQFTSYQAEPEPEPEPQPASIQTDTFEYQSFETVEPVVSAELFSEPSPTFEPVREAEPAVQFDQTPTSAIFGSSPFDTSAEEYAPAGMPSGGFEPAVEPVVEAPVASPAVPKARLSDRPVDLPIEVPEEERRSHNDARRFARLLVSEIKLYNEKKVIEGREASDLYERLREAIDRSREMYDKRVQPPVAAKFDYFHYELVNSLAEGNDARLGSGYPGASV